MKARSLPGVTLQLLPFPAADYAAWRKVQVERRRRWQFGPLWADDGAAAAQARTAVDELAPAEGLSGTHLHRVLGGDGELGWVWTSRQGTDLLVLDAEVDAPAPGLLHLLETHARAGDAKQLVLDRMVAAPTTAALAEEGAFAPVSATMVLPLEGPLRDGASGVRLTPMTEASFSAYLDSAIDEYARELVQGDGLTWEDALRRSRTEYFGLLPHGLHTDGQVLLDVVGVAEGGTVGALWLGLRPPAAAFVEDLYLRPTVRGRGLGRAAMHAAADFCRSRGLSVLGLTVFERNVVARGLYDSLGYTTVVEAARRPVEPAPPVAGPR